LGSWPAAAAHSPSRCTATPGSPLGTKVLCLDTRAAPMLRHCRVPACCGTD
jgi:hypothetical protein